MISNIIVPPSILGRLTRDHPMEPTLRRMLVDDTPPGVLFSPRDPMYAALQSFAAEHPPEGAELVEAPARGWCGSTTAIWPAGSRASSHGSGS
jgi:hypothetical protein